MKRIKVEYAWKMYNVRRKLTSIKCLNFLKMQFFEMYFWFMNSKLFVNGQNIQKFAKYTKNIKLYL